MLNYFIYPGLKTASVPILIEFICKYYDLTEGDLRAKTRKRNIVDCRKALCYYIHEHLNVTCGKIELNYYDLLKIKRLNIRYHHIDFKNLLAVNDKEAVKLNTSVIAFLNSFNKL